MKAKAKATLLPRHGQMTRAVTLVEIENFAGGRLALFRIWRRTILQAMAETWHCPVVFTGISIERNPIMQVPVYFITVTGAEVLADQ